MKVYEGTSRASHAEAALVEATQGFPTVVDMVLVFHSSRQDAKDVARALLARFPSTPIAGCTTSGEMTTEGHQSGSLVVVGIVSDRIRWAVQPVRLVGPFDLARAQGLIEQLAAKVGRRSDELDPRRHFALMFVDGLCGQEESIVAHVSEALGGIPVVGGSAGDDLAFRSTQVIANGLEYEGAAVLVLAESELPFRTFKHQHIVSANRYLAVTRVDADARVLRELDGYPAATAYAGALGVDQREFTAEHTFLHPLTFRYEGEIFVRAVRKIRPDGAVELYGAVEEGMVLDVSDHVDMADALRASVGREAPRAALFLQFNCVLRSLEAERTNRHDALARSLRQLAERVVGFDSYGEQLDGLHINQTLVGIAIGVAS